MELTDPDGASKELKDVGYCCVSVIKREEERQWEEVCLGDARHVGCGLSYKVLRQ